LEPEVAFGIVLRELRKQRGLSQEALAHEAGMERNYISLLELGRNSASVKMIFKLALALEVPVSEFMTLVEAQCKVGQKTKRSK
jgi:transcriptional regulator with XRE-family HTH domain